MAGPTFRSPPGTQDWLPERAALWRRIEETVRATCARYGYREIRTPIFESRALFVRGVGEATEIVEKQMFTFATSEDGEVYALRPEMTASTARAYLEHGLHKGRAFQKFFYIGPAFRHERAQRGRYREFGQFGVEAFGSHDPALDAETARLFADVAAALGLREVGLRVNSIGCSQCRGPIRQALSVAAQSRREQFCENCRRRMERNPLRILDCKEPRCVELAQRLPRCSDGLCAECSEHFACFRRALDALELPHTQDPRLVRGLDYYTRTVYEFTAGGLGAQDAVAGGGRYDGLVAELGGPATGAVGFAAGIDRMALLLGPAAPVSPDAFVVAVRPELRPQALVVTHRLRSAGLSADMDFEGRSVKAQMREANARQARFAVVVGPDEHARGLVRLKDLRTCVQQEVPEAELADRLRRAGT